LVRDVNLINAIQAEVKMQESEIFDPSGIDDWREWLAENHLTKQSVWLVCYNKQSGKKSITWSESVDVALCFGWIDSKKIKIDQERSHQFFSKRKAKGTWSQINKLKIEQLIEQGLVMEAGYKSIEVAKLNGSWEILDSVEQLLLPQDLSDEFKRDPIVKMYYDNLSKSAKKMILQKLVLAKRPETRQKYINELVDIATQNLQSTPIK